MQRFDIIWIGTGQATGTAVLALAAAGKTVAVIERGLFGGSCVNYGCTPTKAMVAAARAAHMVRRAGDFGIRTGEFSVDYSAVRARMEEIRSASRDGLESWLKGMDNVSIFHGIASFVDSHTIEVGQEKLEAERIVIHTGAHARKPPIPGIDDVPWMDSAGLLNREQLPDHLLVIGGSYIGLEFSQIYRRLGSRVTILEKSGQIMFREDADIAASARDFLVREGVDIIENADIRSLEPAESGVRVVLGTGSVEGTHLLVGAGRIPATKDLNLRAAGVHTDSRGYIPVDERLRSNVSHIYAVGDVNGRGAFTHTSVNDGEILADHIIGSNERSPEDRIPVYAMYTDPPLGRIGLSENQARDDGRRILVGTMPMASVSRAKEKSETDGLIKIIVDADTEAVIGAAILGVGGDEIISMMAPALYSGESWRQVRKMVLPHPTVAELIPWVLDGLSEPN